MASIRFALIALCLIDLSGLVGASPDEGVASIWRDFKQQYNKQYGPEEDLFRYKLFKERLNMIELHNIGKSSFKMGINQMTDWSEQELDGLTPRVPLDRLGLVETGDCMDRMRKMGFENFDGAAPAYYDARQTANTIGPIHHQGKCGSCYAFATTGLLEGQQVIRNITNHLIPLSQQQLVDCDLSAGCSGYSVDYALDDIKRKGGIQSSDDYPYNGSLIRERCRFNESAVVMNVEKHRNMKECSNDDLRQILVNYGPVAVGATIAKKSWFNYNGTGILPSEINGETAGHAFLIIGYGTDQKTNESYWLIKNSWGKSWGDAGFARIASKGFNPRSLTVAMVKRP